MTSVHDLSHDLVEEILSRVPMTSLGEMRSTCKLWNTLSKNPSFEHGSKAAKENMVVMMYDFEACLMSVNLHNPSSGSIYKANRFVVWNPYSGQTRWIQPRNDYYTSAYGMGYDSNNNHKILSFSYWPGHSDYEIYDLKTNSWRVLDVSVDWHIYSQGVSLKGNNYFITQNKRWVVGDEELKNCLLCFDFTRERFWDLPLPCHGRFGEAVFLSVVREEKLAVLSRRYGASEMEIWITNKIEANAVSWSYFLKVVDKIPSNSFLYIDGSFFVDEDKKKVVVIYDRDSPTRSNYKACMVGEDGHYKEVDLGESKCQPIMCSPYVPSSVQIQ